MSSKTQPDDVERVVLATIDTLHRNPTEHADPHELLAQHVHLLNKHDSSIKVLKILMWASLVLFIGSLLTGVPILFSITLLVFAGFSGAVMVQTTRRSNLRSNAHSLLRARLAEQVAQAEFAQRQYEQELRDYHAALRANLTAWQQQHPLPPPQPYGVSHNGAEMWVRDWMESMGAEQAVVTQQSRDGGIDVQTPHFIAQVKHYTGSVGIGEIREMAGVMAADHHRRTGLFFTSGQYPASALELAETVHLALFEYDVTTAQVKAMNRLASRFQVYGFNPFWWPKT